MEAAGIEPAQDFNRWDICCCGDWELAPERIPASGRLPLERHIFTVTASVTLDRTEADLDHHLVLRSGRNTMIAETPSSICTKSATAYRRKQMNAARGVARLCSRARVTGVAFFDFLHG